jgi:hypothetical protein
VGAVCLCEVSHRSLLFPLHCTYPDSTASDVAPALLVALDYRGGFQAFMISGDYVQKVMTMAKARRLLSWAPLARP